MILVLRRAAPLRPRPRGCELVLVYDYGGGTFDVTLLSREGGDCRVLASRGDGRLGGADLDHELRRLAAARFKGEGLDFESDRFLAQQLAEAAERAKIELSEREEASISLAFAAVGRQDGPREGRHRALRVRGPRRDPMSRGASSS